MLFLVRLLKHLFILLFVSIPLQIVGILVLIPITRVYSIGHLPYLCRWFDGADYYVGRDTSVVDKINSGIDTPYSYYSGSNLTKNKIWVNKYMWLAWRNPCNYFGYKYLGAQLNVPSYKKRVWVQKVESRYLEYVNKYDYHIGNTTFDVPGYFYQEFKYRNKTYYEYYYIKKYTLFGNSLCLRFRMGWKIGQQRDEQLNKWCQGVCVLQPWMGYWGK